MEFHLGNTIHIVEETNYLQVLKLHDRIANRIPYFFSERDTVKNLNLFIRFQQGLNAEAFVLQHHSTYLSDDQLISSLNDFEIEVVEFFVFQSQEGDISIPLSGVATVGEAIAKLAEHFSVETDYVHLSVCQ